jgi:hypothetical protein
LLMLLPQPLVFFVDLIRRRCAHVLHLTVRYGFLDVMVDCPTGTCDADSHATLLSLLTPHCGLRAAL